MTFSQRCLAVCFAFSLLSACAGDTGTQESVVAGKRLSVLRYGEEPAPAASELRNMILLPEPERMAEWPQAGGLPHHAVQNPFIPAKISEVWQESAGFADPEDNPLIAEPVGANGVVYTIDAKAVVRAFAVRNGRPLWKKEIVQDKSFLKLSALGAGLALDNDMLFAAAGSGEVVAMSAKNGSEIWRTKLSSPVRSAPAVYGGRLYVLTSDNKLTALAEDDGRILWQHYAFLEAVSFLGKAAPALNDGIGVAVFASGEVLGFRPENGSILWTAALGAAKSNDAAAEINDIRARPVIFEDKVFVITSGGLLSALDLKTGGTIWEREIAGLNQPWIAGNALFVMSADGNLTALETQNGRILWQNRLARWKNPETKKERLFWTGPVMAGNRLILTNSDGKAVAVSPQTGTIIGWDDLGETGALPPVVIGDTLFFLSYNANLTAFR